MWLTFGLIFLVNFSEDLKNNTAQESSSSWNGILLGDAGILIFPIIFTAYFFSPLWGYVSAYFFRRNPLYNQQVLYKVEQAGLELASEVLNQKASWSAIGKVREGAKGFILFWGKSKRSFHWLPKDGFSSSADIDTCRDLIKQHVKNFKRNG